jgi:hypothetical protein
MENDPELTEKSRKAPRTDDERWSELLKRMAVPNHTGVYVLGCFARHVTFYSQQVRAMNLIDALCKTGTLMEGSVIGVVGAGLAGLTAAAAALQRGLSVHLFEKDANPQADPGRMPLQTSSDEREVDPFVYDWPEYAADVPQGQEKISAGLPLLNWTAGTASNVRGQILGSFKEVVATAQQSRGKDCIHFHSCKIEERHIGHRSQGGLLVEIDEDSSPIAVDALILAVGFGVEDATHTRSRYWTNDGLAGNQADGKTYLVSGSGDGGLTDVMRLCIADFEHRRVLSKFKNAESIGGELVRAIEERKPNLSKVFVQAAEKVTISPEDIANVLAPRNTRVYLTGSPEHLFGAGSKASILNRLIVAWLLRHRRFKLVDARLQTPVHREGSVEFLRWDRDEPIAQPDVWSFGDGEFTTSKELPASFHVVVRHGPGEVRDSRKVGPLEENFPTLWRESSRENQRYWEEMPHWEDWTRRLWEPDDFVDRPLLDARAGSGRTYVVVEHPGTGGLVQSALGTVIGKLHQNDDPASAPSFVSLNLIEDFETPHRFGRAVRALCRADIVVFDLTEEEKCPEAYVLLGIRSIARRGITIVTARFKDPEHEPERSDAPFAVPEMPFLLRDIGFYGWGQEDKFITRLKKGVEEGLARAQRLGPIYRDLPAYEEVRRLGPEPEDYRAQGPDEAVLFLTPFDEKYRKHKGSWLKSRVGAEDKGIYIVESASPERTSIKLYNAIRRTQLCIVDWTHRRPNVFFELGVRLAVNPKPPVCVIHKDHWPKNDKGELAGGIFKLFNPLVYDEKGSFAERQEFERAIQSRRRALAQEDSAAEWPLNGATLSPDFVYREVRSATPNEVEDWSIPVWKELRTAANLILGSKPDQYPDLPILFGDDEDYERQARLSAIDRLLAAWHFVERRYDIRRELAAPESGIEWEKDPWKSWLEIGRVIERELKYESRADYVRMRDEISSILKMARRRN